MNEICEICGAEDNDLYPCERCDSIICPDCQAEYNQFTQIDYNCCESCADRTGEYDYNKTLSDMEQNNEIEGGGNETIWFGTDKFTIQGYFDHEQSKYICSTTGKRYCPSVVRSKEKPQEINIADQPRGQLVLDSLLVSRFAHGDLYITSKDIQCLDWFKAYSPRAIGAALVRLGYTRRGDTFGVLDTFDELVSDRYVFNWLDKHMASGDKYWVSIGYIQRRIAGLKLSGKRLAKILRNKGYQFKKGKYSTKIGLRGC